MACAGCGNVPGLILPDESTGPIDTARFELLARFVHITDTHMTDEESPARLTVFAELSGSAWRAQGAYSTQLLDGVVRTVNKLHVAEGPIDFLIHTGDAADNAQLNELQWFVTLMDGGTIDPLTGPDDREEASRPKPLLDPHQPFSAQGLYRNGVHGEASTIRWYGLMGNHDRFAVGVLPIVTNVLGRRVAPVPLDNRIGLFLPTELDPTGLLSWAPITPTSPGPPPAINWPMLIPANPQRRYATDRDFIELLLGSDSKPSGHGFSANHPDRTWYSVLLMEGEEDLRPTGLRLIGLNSADPLMPTPRTIHSEGAISLGQFFFLKDELARAQAGGEWVIVATHHPSESLELSAGSSVTPVSFVSLLNDYSCVKLHLAGHWHRSAVIDRGGYLEIVTGSIIDAPQQGRMIEVWQSTEPRALARADSPSPEPRALARTDSPSPEPRASVRAGDETPADRIELRYWMFSHLDEIAPPDEADTILFDDPLMPMRRIAAELAGGSANGE